MIVVKIWSNNASIDNLWYICNVLDATLSVKESFPQDMYRNMYQCIHVVDEWEVDLDSKRNEYFSDPKVEDANTIAIHRTKFGFGEDGFKS